MSCSLLRKSWTLLEAEKSYSAPTSILSTTPWKPRPAGRGDTVWTPKKVQSKGSALLTIATVLWSKFCLTPWLSRFLWCAHWKLVAWGGLAEPGGRLAASRSKRIFAPPAWSSANPYLARDQRGGKQSSSHMQFLQATRKYFTTLANVLQHSLYHELKETSGAPRRTKCVQETYIHVCF